MSEKGTNSQIDGEFRTASQRVACADRDVRSAKNVASVRTIKTSRASGTVTVRVTTRSPSFGTVSSK